MNLNSKISESFSQFNCIEDVKPDLREIIAKKKQNMKLLLSKKSQIKNLDENSPSVFRMNHSENPIYNIEKYDIKAQINKNYEFIDNSRSSKKVETFFPLQNTCWQAKPTSEQIENDQYDKIVSDLEDLFYHSLVLKNHKK